VSNYPTDPLPPNLELSYQAPERYGNAATLVKLAGIFNIVSFALDLVYGIGMGALCVLFISTSAHGGSAPKPWVPVAIFAGFGVASFLVAIPKCIGAFKLLRQGKNAWGWGLAAGICGCVQVWTFEPCCLPMILFMGIGIFTVVISCLTNVRAYLAIGQRTFI